MRRRVDCRLRVVALNEPVLGFHDAAFAVGKVLSRFGIGLLGGRGGWLSRFLAPFGSPVVLGLGPRFRLDLQFGLRRPDLLGALLLIHNPIRHLIAALVAAEGLVFPLVQGFAGAHPASDLGPELRCPLGNALIAHRLLLGGVRLDLRAVERDMAELRQSGPFAQLQNPREQAVSAFRRRLRKSETVRKSGASSPTMLMKSTRSRAAF